MAAPSGVMRPPPSHHRQLKDRSYEEEDEEQTRPASKRPFSGPDWPRGMRKELGTQPRGELERNAPHDISVRQLSLSCVWRFGSTWATHQSPRGTRQLFTAYLSPTEGTDRALQGFVPILYTILLIAPHIKASSFFLSKAVWSFSENSSVLVTWWRRM